MEDVQTENQKTRVMRLPSDYSDVSSKTYDPEFISDISFRMQVPNKISIDAFNHKDGLAGGEPMAVRMSVPDRLIVAGEEKHIGMRESLQRLDFDKIDPEALSFVGLMTPPRTLTLEERFPMVEAEEEKRSHSVVRHYTANGMAPVPYTPGVSPNDMLLLNEEDDATQIRTQVAKLTRRIATLEQDGQRRAMRETIFYPLVFGYFVFKVFLWFFRAR